jgi:Protein of unknown function (DUF3300)
MRNRVVLAFVVPGLVMGSMIWAPGFRLTGQEPGAPPPYPPPNQGGPPQNAAPGPTYPMESPERLQQLVAPIALYPDSLVATILAASSYPSQIEEAYNWLAPRRNLPPEQIASEADQQDWDASVKALLPFPPVLQNLASNLSWTSELGDAYYNQPSDVMNAIQVMRQRAKKAGTLKSNDRIHVTDKHGYITIDEVQPEDVYVPAYDPWVVYGYPVVAWPGWIGVPGIWWNGPGLYFGLGFGIGAWMGFGWASPWWGIDWFNRGLFFHHAPYFAGGPAFFNRGDYYHGYGGFAHPIHGAPGQARGFARPEPGRGVRSGVFGHMHYGGATRGYAARGQRSFGGAFHAGGFRGGGFHGGGSFHSGGRH